VREERSARANARIGRIQAADARRDRQIRSTERLAELHRLIASWPGLVSDSDPALVEDSLVLLDLLDDALSLVDVGSGGGLPGLPLKLARPELQVTLVEANHKKAAFLTHAIAVLGLQGVEVVAKRAEEAGRRPELRDRFDVATARALAPMPVLAELCLPFVRPGGRLLAMKAEGEPELEAVRPALAALNAEAAGVVPTPSAARSLGRVLVVRKLGPTPDAYPRRPGVPARRPLTTRNL
jgi:16S rRNA (guanine527-N7)-methyltransferase